MQEGDPILGGDANNVSGGQTPENGNVPSLSDTNGDSTAKDIDAALSSVTMPDSSESSDSSDPSELKISHDDSPIPPPVHILGQDITGITDEDFTPLPPNPEPTPQIIMPSGSPEVPAEPTAPEASTSPQTNTSSSIGAIPTAPNSTSTQAPGAETPVAPTVTTSAAAIPLQTASQPIASTAPAPVQPESPAPNSNYAAEFKQSVKASVSGESGDIILSKDPKDPKKTRKGLIIGIAIALIVVVGLCAGLGITISNNKSNGNIFDSNQSNNKVDQEDINNFYIYANELIYGEEGSINPLEEEIDIDSYAYLQRVNNTISSDQEYFSNLYDKYNNFYSKLDFNSEDDEHLAIYNIAYGYKELLDFIKINPSSYDFSGDRIIDTYLNDGAEAAYALKDEILSKIPMENYYSQNFYDLKSIEIDSYLTYMDTIDYEGCIIDGKVDGVCAENATEIDENGDSIKISMFNATDEVRNLLTKHYKSIGLDCWQLGKAIKGEN